MLNEKVSNTLLLLALVVSVILLLSHSRLPHKNLVVWPSTKSTEYFYDTVLPDGTRAAGWVNKQQRHWRCTFPDKYQGHFPCGISVSINSNPVGGIDLSRYSHVKIKIRYQGSANNIQFSMRNYNSAYAVQHDPNSAKFMGVSIWTKELTPEMLLDIRQFTVGHWWLVQYHPPHKLAMPELHNVVSFNVDFPSVEEIFVGQHDIWLDEITFVGDYVTAEHWYLTILGVWLAGIFAWIIFRYALLYKHSKQDALALDKLNKSNHELQLETDNLRKISTVDGLTKAFNRFGIHQIISNLSGIANNGNDARYALIMMDIDHFKKINDTRGHDAGDRVLQTLAEIISFHYRAKDFLGRWGGEEFLIILPGTSKEYAMEFAEKIRLIISETPFEPENPLKVTASFGVAERNSNEDFSMTFKRVDTALYVAKANGRNCCVMAQDH
jgi:diguanylate cyclase (GGDEF)-like protein